MWGNRVLIVDDDPDVVVYLRSFLEDNGYETRGAGDSARALAALDGFNPDAILVDVLLPGKSGMDLMVTLRKSKNWCDTPLVLVTGLDQILQSNCQPFLGPGVRGPDAAIAKPVDPNVLLTVLKKLETDAVAGDE